MRAPAVGIGALLSIFFLVGCQETRLRERTLLLSSSVNDIYYRQVLNQTYGAIESECVD
jgi:hypothetical protein